MKTAPFISRAIFILALISLPVFSAVAQDTADDVVRVNTELVQTDFMVFDKQGKFVDGLKPEQLLFKVEGKQRNVSFLDRIAAGSRNEEAQIAAARGTAAPNAPAPLPLDRGRTVLFFVDDLHLSLGSLGYAREMIKNFVEKEMQQNDQAEIASSSGQLGFLQQLTDNKSVLLVAADRVRYQQFVDVQGSEYPPMTEYQGMQIQRGDTELFNFLVDKLIERTPRFPRVQAEQIIRGRSREMVNQGAAIAARAFVALRAFIDLVEPLPGRKIVFFISDGFLIDENRTDNWDRLQRITSAAARAGVVIYSIDARGVAGIIEPTEQDRSLRDPRGILRRANSGEFHATQDGMSSLASATGGRAFFNTNNLKGSLATGLKEASTYYLLAWRPETEEQRSPKFRKIELSVVGRPDLVVRFRRGFGEPPDETAKKKTKENNAPPARKTPDEELKSVLSAPYPNRKMPVAISLNFLDTAQFGGTLRTAIKVGTSSLMLNQEPEGAAALDVAIVVLNDQGKSVSSFSQRFTIRAPAKNTNKPPESVFYDHVAPVKPGLYQVRVAVIDVKNGVRGSAYEWIEVPNVASKQLTLSSLVIGERKPEDEVRLAAATSRDPRQPEPLKELPVNVDHRFAASSYLRLLTFIYNATVGASDTKPVSDNAIPASTNARALPDLDVQVQVFRDNEPVVTTPLHKIQTEGISDVQRVPYAAEVSLNGLPPGAYVLQVTVIDKLAKASATRKLNFQIE